MSSAPLRMPQQDVVMSNSDGSSKRKRGGKKNQATEDNAQDPMASRIPPLKSQKDAKSALLFAQRLAKEAEGALAKMQSGAVCKSDPGPHACGSFRSAEVSLVHFDRS
jgi:hypothetical protein